MKREFSPAGARRTKQIAGAMTAAVAAGAALAVASPPADAAKAFTVIAHRGDRDDAPENTVAAFEMAISKGAHVIELDIQYSDTGYPVVMHDDTLNRTTSCTGKVDRKSRTQVKKCDAGEWFSSRYDDERVPTLRGALSAISKRSSSIQLLLHMKKTPTPLQADRTMDDVKAYGLTDRTYILASNSATFRMLRAEGARHFAFIFNSSSGWDRDYEIMIPHDTRISDSGIERAHSRGNQVWAVENHPDGLSELIREGRVDGILANHLDRLLRKLSPYASAEAAPESDTGAGGHDAAGPAS